jgi:preprotein translocase subunit SecG
MILLDEKGTTEILVEVSKMLTPIFLSISIVLTLWVEHRNKKRAKEAKDDTNTVAEALVNTDTKTTKKLDTIHTLVNSGMGIQLRISSAALRRIADLTGKDADVAIADEAERLTKEHENKQRHLDIEIKKRKERENAA